MARRHLGTVAILALASASLGPAFSRSRAKPLYAGWPTMNINVVEFGADPTGKNDSTAAIQAAVDAAANVSAAPNRPSVIGSGGVLVDFVGGTFAVSAPITLYGYRYNGLVLRGGTLVVMPSFAASGFALDLRQISQVNIEDLTIDMQHSGGCARFDDTLQSTVTNLFCLHYSSWGVLGDDQYGMGHELTIADSFFAEFMWGEPGYNVTALQNGTAIEMRFPDSNILNVVIRCTRVGVVDLSGSNSWQNLHIYATCNKDPSGSNVAVGFYAGGSQTRIGASYFDDSPLIVPAHMWLLTLTDSLFYGLSDLVVAPLSPNVTPVGLMASRNIFSYTDYGQPRACVDTSGGSVVVAGMGGVAISGNAFANASVGRATSATVTVAVAGSANSTSVPPACTRVDLGAVLLFSGAQEKGRAQAGDTAAATRACDGGWRGLVRSDLLSSARPLRGNRAGGPPLPTGAQSDPPALVAGVAQFWLGSAMISASSGFPAPLALAPSVTLLEGGTGGVVTVCVGIGASGGPVPSGTTATWSATAYLTFDQSAPAFLTPS